MANGYFGLVHRNDGTYLQLVPPTDGGQGLNVREIMDYLSSRNVIYDLKAVNDAVAMLNGKSVIQLNRDIIRPERENYLMEISPDKMKVTVRFYPASVNESDSAQSGGQNMTAAELLADLHHRNIRFGILSDVINDYFANRVYCTDIVVAQGKEPRQGHDAYVEYFFDTNRKAKPKLLEDGSVDFHSLNTIVPVQAGDLLARLHEADPGEEGKNIHGEVIKPANVRNKKLQFGHNITLSEDQMEIVSDVNGHVSLAGERVFVSDVYTIENVGPVTGDVDYDGSILVTGNIMSGYKVKATGDIQVNGVVEGAEVEAGGNISIARGMNGMSKGKLVAGGNIITKFLENAEASAGNFISTESILHCNVQAGTEIEVTGKRGFITGGHVMASNIIRVKTLGSNIGASTLVEVGINPRIKIELNQLKEQEAKLKKSLMSIEPVLMGFVKKKQMGASFTPEQLKYAQQLMETRGAQMEELNKVTLRLSEVEAIVGDSQNPCVEVTGEVFPGTKISIMDVSMTVKNPMSYCKFIRSQGDVKMTAL